MKKAGVVITAFGMLALALSTADAQSRDDRSPARACRNETEAPVSSGRWGCATPVPASRSSEAMQSDSAVANGSCGADPSVAVVARSLRRIDGEDQ